MGIGQKADRNFTCTSQNLQGQETRCIRIGELEIFAMRDEPRQDERNRCFGTVPGAAGPSGVTPAFPENIVEVLIKQEPGAEDEDNNTAQSSEKTQLKSYQALQQRASVTVTLESSSDPEDCAVESLCLGDSEDAVEDFQQKDLNAALPKLLSDTSLVLKLKQRIQEKIQATVEVMKDVKPSPTSIAIPRTEQQPVDEERIRQRFFTCKVCDRIFVRKCSLDSHRCKHEYLMKKKRIYHCDSCPQIFKSKLSYFNHRRWHSVTKLRAHHYRCDVCRQVFTQKITLKRHRQTHFTREKTLNRPKRYIILHQYHCALCDQIFLNAENLSLHQKLHSVSTPATAKGESEIASARTHKRFVCDSCGEVFTDRTSQAFHAKLHEGSNFTDRVAQREGRDDLACDVCGRHYLSEFLLTMHTRLHHAIS